jgi:hypothetical protein
MFHRFAWPIPINWTYLIPTPFPAHRQVLFVCPGFFARAYPLLSLLLFNLGSKRPERLTGHTSGQICVTGLLAAHAQQRTPFLQRDEALGSLQDIENTNFMETSVAFAHFCTREHSD